MDIFNGKAVSGMKSSCSTLSPTSTHFTYTQLQNKELGYPIIQPVLLLLYNLLFWLNFYPKVQAKAIFWKPDSQLSIFLPLSLLFLCRSQSSKWFPMMQYLYFCIIFYVVSGLVCVTDRIWWRGWAVISKRRWRKILWLPLSFLLAHLVLGEVGTRVKQARYLAGKS